MTCRKCLHPIVPEKQLFRTGRCHDICGACQFEGLATFVESDEPEDTPKEISDGEQAGAAMRDCAGWIRKNSQ